ncbi:hypothetical protein [Aristophania vespae]|nr:hypothetical protein [Aristophania vespae]UMM64392.1 hypothetical protein DM15PD_14060 [Aristophania vespae]
MGHPPKKAEDESKLPAKIGTILGGCKVSFQDHALFNIQVNV